MMKFSELKGRAVVNLEEARKIGEVDDLLFEPDGHRIVSLKVKTGLFGAGQVVSTDDVKNIGADAVTVSGGADLARVTPDTAVSGPDPGPSSPGLPPPEEQPANGLGATGLPPVPDASPGSRPSLAMTKILGHKVVTGAGTAGGGLDDAIF